MPRIVFSQTTFCYDLQRPFAQPFDLTLVGPGFIGLVGPNGAGKSTLIKLITGELQPMEGRVRLEPQDLCIASIHQTTQDSPLSPAVLNFAQALDGEARILRERLALEPNELQRWPTLSAGERQRWQLAQALHAQPDIMLCDEPSNHLDADSRTLMIAALAHFRGLGLMISHDRELLDRLCPQTVFVAEDGEVEWWDLPYSRAMAEREREYSHRVVQHKLVKDEWRQAKVELQASRLRHASAVHSTQRSNRQKKANDSDARTMAQQNRSEWAAKSHAKSLNRAQNRENQAHREFEAWTPTKTLHADLFVHWKEPPRRSLVQWTMDDCERLSPHPWLNLGCEPLVHIARHDKIWLRGANGAGKSTLLNFLHQRAVEGLPAERVLWMPQEYDEKMRTNLHRCVHGLAKDERGKVLQILAHTGVAPENVLRSAAHSPGEARKVALALGLAQEAWLLLLDEPSNHLDHLAVTSMQKMLADYPGALVIATHDAQLARATTTKIWDLDPSDPGLTEAGQAGGKKKPQEN